MKTVICAVALAAGTASADVYNDATGEVFDAGFTHLDISSVEITNDSQYLYIEVTNSGLVSDTNWGKYLVGIDTGANAGDNSTDPGSWNRNVDWGRGITHLLGTWADEGGNLLFGGEIRQFDGTNWNLLGATWQGDTNISGTSASTQLIQVEFASLGLTIGDSFEFDVISSGGNGGDPGVDHLSNALQSTPGWGDQSVAGQFLSYTLVPAPSSVAILGLGGLAAVRRRR